MVQCGRQSFKGIFLSISTMYRSWFQAGGVVSGTDLPPFRHSLGFVYERMISAEKEEIFGGHAVPLAGEGPLPPIPKFVS